MSGSGRWRPLTEGAAILLPLGLMGVVTLFLAPPLGVVSLVAAALVVYAFRDPDRTVDANPAVALSPADGTVLRELHFTPPSGTAPATDPALIVTFSPNSPLPAGSNVLGTVTANLGTSGDLALDATLTNGNQTSRLTDGTYEAVLVPGAAGSGDAALVVAGRITVAELRPLVEKALGDWAKGASASPAISAPSPVAQRLLIVDRPGAPQTQLRVASLGVARSSPDYPALRVMNETLGGLFSSRINLNLREEHG